MQKGLRRCLYDTLSRILVVLAAVSALVAWVNYSGVKIAFSIAIEREE